LRPGRLARRSFVDRPIGSSDGHDIPACRETDNADVDRCGARSAQADGVVSLAKAAALVAATTLATLAGAAIAAGQPQGQMASDLATRDRDIHWAAGFEP
jgi:hypothetical protein